jgi:predicted 2-oxoglutarate/Fe(II)-dependent dioxygenase YbiX
MLNPEILDNKEEIRSQLRQPVLIIKNALIQKKAEQLHDQLLGSPAWIKQNRKTDDYRFNRDIIPMESDAAPPLLKELYALLMSKDTRQWFSDVSGRHCDCFKAAATLYHRGNQLTEHNDRYIYEEPGKPRYVRALTFNYYLAKNWKPAWGGDFVWREPYQRISPEFNTLVLFNVTTNSHHWVEPVTDDAAARLSVTGWYLSEIKQEKFKLSIHPMI